MKDVEIEGVVIPKGERCGLMFAAANRDPRQWKDPDRYDIKRQNRGNVAGVTACTRASAVCSHCWKRKRCSARSSSMSSAWESAGPVEPWMTTIGHGPAKLPVKLFAAKSG